MLTFRVNFLVLITNNRLILTNLLAILINLVLVYLSTFSYMLFAKLLVDIIELLVRTILLMIIERTTIMHINLIFYRYCASRFLLIGVSWFLLIGIRIITLHFYRFLMIIWCFLSNSSMGFILIFVGINP